MEEEGEDEEIDSGAPHASAWILDPPGPLRGQDKRLRLRGSAGEWEDLDYPRESFLKVGLHESIPAQIHQLILKLE